MNQQQRKFLIDKITTSIKVTAEALSDRNLKPPSLSNYLLHAVMSGSFEIKSNEEIKEMIVALARNSVAGDSWMEGKSSSWGNEEGKIIFDPSKFFILPPEYVKLRTEYETDKTRLAKELAEYKLRAEALIVRLNLASDKTLEKMISEVDNMGDIKIIDTKLKALTA